MAADSGFLGLLAFLGCAAPPAVVTTELGTAPPLSRKDCQAAMQYKLEALEVVEPSEDPDSDPIKDVVRQARELGLDDAALCTVHDALDGMADPCAPSRTVLAALTEMPRLCERSRLLGQLAVELARDGQGTAVVVRELFRLLERESRARAELAFDGSPFSGNRRSRLVLAEFVDFGCSVCRKLSPKVRGLAARAGAVLYVKHYPQPVMHPGAEYAARASLAADRQGKFWPVYDALFALDVLSEEAVNEACRKAGLDMARYGADMRDPALQAIVARDVREAEAFGLSGTPAFFVNGTRVADVEEMERRLRVEPAAKDGATPAAPEREEPK